MSFTERDKLKALAIVHIFETSKPFGDYAACVVLNDGAGVSYGINQFTHRSGSLLEVVNNYLDKGGAIGRAAIIDALPLLKQKGAGAIGELSGNTRFKKALKAAAVTAEMKTAQHEISEKRYLRPAIEAAEGSGFVLPISLAVIFDSINHGSFARIRDRVLISRKNYNSDIEFEKAWIYSYVKNRDAWLESIPRLAVTDYRTDFFLAQIARGNWSLNLPLNVHGCKLTDEMIQVPAVVESQVSAVEPELPAVVLSEHPTSANNLSETNQTPLNEAQPSNQAEAGQGEGAGTAGEAPASGIGHSVTDDAVKVTGRGWPSLGLGGIGGVGGVIAFIKGFASDNMALIITGIICLTVIILAIVFRQLILDYVKMNCFSDPNRYNVK